MRVIISMCESGSCASGVTKMLSVRHGLYRIPSSMWILSKVRNVCTDADVMEKRCRDMIRGTIHEARRTGLLRDIPHTMAIDTHLIPRYDKNPRTREEQLVRSRHRSGTSRFEGAGIPRLHLGTSYIWELLVEPRGLRGRVYHGAVRGQAQPERGVQAPQKGADKRRSRA